MQIAPKVRACYVLKNYGRFTNREIANLLYGKKGLVSTVTSNICRARESMTSQLIALQNNKQALVELIQIEVSRDDQYSYLRDLFAEEAFEIYLQDFIHKALEHNWQEVQDLLSFGG